MEEKTLWNLEDIDTCKLSRVFENGMMAKYTGIPIIIHTNGDLVFHCGSFRKAKQLFCSIRNLIPKNELIAQENIND